MKREQSVADEKANKDDDFFALFPEAAEEGKEHKAPKK